MKFIRPMKQWEKDLIKHVMTGGTYERESTWFKGFGVYFDGKTYWWVTCWDACGTRAIYKGLKA